MTLDIISKNSHILVNIRKFIDDMQTVLSSIKHNNYKKQAAKKT